MLQFTYKLKLTERVKAKCSRHPRYNPEKDGRAGIRGGCSTCFSLYDLHQARLALDLVQTAQDQGEAVGRGHDSPYLIRNARMRPRPPLRPGPHPLSSASCLGEWQEALSLPHPRAEHPLVAQDPVRDLFIGAKDLSIAAMDGTSPSRLTGGAPT